MSVASLCANAAVLVFLQRSIDERQLTQLLLLVLVLVIIDDHQQLFYQLHRIVHHLHRGTVHMHVQLIVLVRAVMLGTPLRPVLHAALAADADLRACFLLHTLLGVPSGSNNNANEVVRGVLLVGNINFLERLGANEVRWRLIQGVHFQQLFDSGHALLSEGFTHTHLPCVGTHTPGVVLGRRRGRSVGVVLESSRVRRHSHKAVTQALQLHLQHHSLLHYLLSDHGHDQWCCWKER
mmetsp:Transcript_24172/g.41059  ORF Transcript_24172/g.41059 Transcript_24172/m.41059 type:complete len:237 (-) Transcript_24172:254-964(-)